MLNLLAAVFDLCQSERGRGALKKVAKLAELFQIFGCTRKTKGVIGYIPYLERRYFLA